MAETTVVPARVASTLTGGSGGMATVTTTGKSNVHPSTNPSGSIITPSTTQPSGIIGGIGASMLSPPAVTITSFDYAAVTSPVAPLLTRITSAIRSELGLTSVVTPLENSLLAVPTTILSTIPAAASFISTAFSTLGLPEPTNLAESLNPPPIEPLDPLDPVVTPLDNDIPETPPVDVPEVPPVDAPEVPPLDDLPLDDVPPADAPPDDAPPDDASPDDAPPDVPPPDDAPLDDVAPPE